MGIKSQKDFFSGLMFLVVGLLFAYGASAYSMGNGARMGPGYFPRLLGIILAGIGAVVLYTSMVKKVKGGDKIGSFAWKPLFFIIAANLVFGVLLGGLPSFKIPAMGLIVAIFGVTFIAGKAGDTFNAKESLILAVILSVLSYLAFVVLLKLQFPVWPTFITS
jgi:hypothetical protein